MVHVCGCCGAPEASQRAWHGARFLASASVFLAFYPSWRASDRPLRGGGSSVSTAPDGCFPRHDGSGADPRRTLKARCGEGTGSFRASKASSWKQKQRRAECARLHRQRAVALHQLCTRRGVRNPSIPTAAPKRSTIHTAAASPRGTKTDPAPGGGAPQEAPRAPRRGTAGPPSRRGGPTATQQPR